MTKVVPVPAALSAWIEPPCFWTMLNTIARPRPVPLSFVVKNGSKIFSRVSRDMPVPVSETRILTAASSSSARTVSSPVPAMASQALAKRLRKTCSSCSGSTQMTISSGTSVRRSRTPLMSRVRPSWAQAPPTRPRSSTNRGFGSRPRANPSRSLTIVLTRIVSPKMSFRPRLR